MGKRPPIPPDIERGPPPRAPFRPPNPVPWFAWLVPLILAANFVIFATTMYVNDCPARSDECILFNVLGRLSFQPVKENLLLGPSIPTLRKLGALERKLVEDGEKWRLVSCIWLHGGLLHLMANMISLLCIGMRSENWSFVCDLWAWWKSYVLLDGFQRRTCIGWSIRCLVWVTWCYALGIDHKLDNQESTIQLILEDF